MAGIAKFVKYQLRSFSIFRLMKSRALVEWFVFLKKAFLDTNKEDNLMNFRCGRLRRSNLEAGTYWLTRIVFLRSLGILYLVAFAVAVNQNRSLVGRHGICPAEFYLKRSRESPHLSKLRAFFHKLAFIIFEGNIISRPQQQYAYLGVLLAGIVVVYGCANMVIMLLLWMFYSFIVHVEQQWYSFGWESLLLDMGFLAIFLCPVWKAHQGQSPPSHVIVWICRLFAISMVMQDFLNRQHTQCWSRYACMSNSSYETQPVPTVVSYYLHQSPEGFRKIQASTANIIEPVISIFVLFPRPFRIWSGIFQIFYQVVRIIGSNYSSFQYWVALLPSIMCFDDKALVFIFSSSSTVNKVAEVQQSCKRTVGTRITKGYWYYVFQVLPLIMFLYVSLPAVGNFFTFHLAGNSSLSLRGQPVGAAHKLTTFTSVLAERREVILQGTRNSTITPDERGGIWMEYEFNCKPGDTKRRPCLPSPYHYKLDWLMWHASIQTYQHNPWVINLAAKLLSNDVEITAQIAYNPFINGAPPSFVRGELYLYKFTRPDSQEAREGHWWTRTKLGSYFPAVSWKEVHSYVEYHGWEARKLEEKIPPEILSESVTLSKRQEKRTS